MDNPQKTPANGNDRPRLAGGIFLFFGLLTGAIIGVAIGEASLGMVTGFAVGGAAALLVWLFDSRRR